MQRHEEASEDGRRDWSFEAPGQGMPTTAGDHQKLGERCENLLPQSIQGTQLCQHLGFDFFEMINFRI